MIEPVKAGRLAGLSVLVALVSSQAGHQLAYQLRNGAAAQQLQSTGAHAYLPVVVKTALGLAAGFVLVALLVIGLARMVAGRKIEASAPPPSLLRLVALLFSIQLACFLLQETVESAAGGQFASPVSLLLWGAAGQLPAALVAALALRRLAVHLAPAVAELWTRLTFASGFATQTLAVAPLPFATVASGSDQQAAFAFDRRGPPS